MIRRRSTTASRSKEESRSSSKPKTRNSSKYCIDGVEYKSKALYDYHIELSNNPLVTSFTLASANIEKSVRGKYGSYKTEVNGIVFDSIMESRFYIYLLELMEAGEIKSFQRQVTFLLQEKFRDPWTNKVILPITYIADFVVVDREGNETVIDIKGVETDVFKIKKKLFQHKYPKWRFLCLRRVPLTGEWLDLEDIKKLKKGR